jgi:hypothetical protein
MLSSKPITRTCTIWCDANSLIGIRSVGGYCFFFGPITEIHTRKSGHYIFFGPINETDTEGAFRNGGRLAREQRIERRGPEILQASRRGRSFGQ